MALITLHYFTAEHNSHIYGTDTKEIIVNSNSIHKIESETRSLVENNKYTGKIVKGTEVYLNEWVSKYEPKKKYFVAETPEYILEHSA